MNEGGRSAGGRERGREREKERSKREREREREGEEEQKMSFVISTITGLSRNIVYEGCQIRWSCLFFRTPLSLSRLAQNFLSLTLSLPSPTLSLSPLSPRTHTASLSPTQHHAPHKRNENLSITDVPLYPALRPLTPADLDPFSSPTFLSLSLSLSPSHSFSTEVTSLFSNHG